jgi:hypothetical protein
VIETLDEILDTGVSNIVFTFSQAELFLHAGLAGLHKRAALLASSLQRSQRLSGRTCSFAPPPPDSGLLVSSARTMRRDRECRA